MSLHVHGNNIGSAWVAAYGALATARHSETVNLTVTIDDPGMELLGVRQAIDAEVALLKARGRPGFNKSVHTVANTIFPVSLYHEGRPTAFYDAAIKGQSGRDGKITSWGPNSGTYIGRLLQYPTYGGQTFNQLERMLKNLDATINYQDSYEITFECELPDPHTATLFPSASTFLPSYDNSHRGGQCLSHVSLNCSPDGALSMAALYRHQTYLTRAYGNFLGLSRLLHFLVRESKKDLHAGELMIVASHADIDHDARGTAAQLLEVCRSHVNDDPTAIEWHSRPFGSKWSDLNLPAVPL